jgi:hypothetical protein
VKANIVTPNLEGAPVGNIQCGAHDTVIVAFPHRNVSSRVTVRAQNKNFVLNHESLWIGRIASRLW